jgi:hypothetical protein
MDAFIFMDSLVDFSSLRHNAMPRQPFRRGPRRA